VWVIISDFGISDLSILGCLRIFSRERFHMQLPDFLSSVFRTSCLSVFRTINPAPSSPAKPKPATNRNYKRMEPNKTLNLPFLSPRMPNAIPPVMLKVERTIINYFLFDA
jgi:hypothetical protein